MCRLGIGLDRETKPKGLHSTQPGKVVTSTDSKGLQCRQPVHTATSSDVVPQKTDSILTVKQESQTGTTSTVTSMSDIKVPVTELSSTKTQINYNPPVNTPVSLILAKVNVKPRDRIKVTQEMLDCIPTSWYSKCTRELSAVDITPEISKGDYSKDDSDTTIIYWRNDNPIKTGKKHKGRKLKKSKMEKPK